MSARKYWPAAAVVALGAALFFSNRPVGLPDGGQAIVTENAFIREKERMEKLAIPRIAALDQGKKLSEDDMAKLREASGIVDRVLEYQPTRVSFFYLSGRIHRILGEDSIAAERFLQAREVVENDVLTHEANKQIILETSAECAYQLSLIRMEQNNPKAALEAADTAVKTVLNSSNYIYARARALAELRRYPEAKRDLETALKLDPNNTLARGLLNFISKQ